MGRYCVLLLLFASDSWMFGQPPIPEWNHARQIKLLESSRTDVKRILTREDFLVWGDERRETFSGNDALIEVDYSSGACSGEFAEWDVPAGIVTQVTVTPKNVIDAKEVGIDYSSFRKERIDPQRKSIFARYDKDRGIAISFFGRRLDSIFLFPPKLSYGKLCDKPKVKEYFFSKRWAREPTPDDMIIDYNRPANVVDVTVVPQGEGLFGISTKAIDPENDVLTYNYLVSGGKIIGKGASVIWDLADAPAGTYKITAAVDDGCGLCGKYITKTVAVP